MATRRTTAKRSTGTRGKRTAGSARKTTSRARSTTAKRTTGTSRMKTASRGTGARRATPARRTSTATRGRAASSTAPSKPTTGFGSIFRMAVQPGRKDEVKKLMIGSPTAIKGMKSVHLFDTGGDELWGVAVFSNEKSYRDNASSPEQNRRYMEFRRFLQSDPEWHDANVQSFQP